MRSGSTDQSRRADPGNVREVGERDLGVPLAHERGRDIEVVVVEEDRGLRLALELLDDSVGEVAVDGDVAVVPGRAEIPPGVVLALPEPVLDEPEHRVRDHVVVEVVGGGRVRDEPEPVARAVEGGLVDRALRRDDTVLVRDRARDPRDVVMGDERRQRRDQAAGATLRDPFAPLTPVRDRTAVRDDDQLPPFGHVEAQPRAA